MALALRTVRREKGLTQAELSDVSGVGRTTIAQIEAGSKTNVTTDTLTRLADALGVSVAELFR